MRGLDDSNGGSSLVGGLAPPLMNELLRMHSPKRRKLPNTTKRE